MCLFCLPLLQEYGHSPCLLTLPFKGSLSRTMHKMKLCPQKGGLKLLGEVKAELYHLCAKLNFCHYSSFQQRSARLLRSRWLHHFIIWWLPFHPPAPCCFSAHMERSRHAKQKNLQRDLPLTLLWMIRASQGVYLPASQPDISPCSRESPYIYHILASPLSSFITETEFTTGLNMQPL